MIFSPVLQAKAPWNDIFATPASDNPKTLARSMRAPFVAVVNTCFPPANAITVSEEPGAVASITQPLIVTRSSSKRLISSIAPFTSEVPRRPAVCTAAIKLLASDTGAFVKIVIAGVTGPVSHNTTMNPDIATAPPIVQVTHLRIQTVRLADFFLGGRDFSTAI